MRPTPIALFTLLTKKDNKMPEEQEPKELSLQTLTQGLTPSEASDAHYRKRATQQSYLPSLKIIHGTSKEVQEFKAKPGNWWLTQRALDLTDKVQVCVVGRRPHAIYIANGKKELESFDEFSPVFKEICDIADTKQPQNCFASWSNGEFLCFLPKYREFGMFFPGAKSARNIANEFFDHMKDPKDRSENTKDLPHTNCFELYMEMTSFGKNFQAYVPFITPIPPEKNLFPLAPEYEAAMKIFMAPVKAEAEGGGVEEAANSTDSVDR